MEQLYKIEIKHKINFCHQKKCFMINSNKTTTLNIKQPHRPGVFLFFSSNAVYFVDENYFLHNLKVNYVSTSLIFNNKCRQ